MFRKPHQISVPAFLRFIFSSVHSKPAFGTTFRIMGGFRNNFYSHRRLSKSRNKLSEEGYWRHFQLVSDFREASRNFILVFFTKWHSKIVKTNSTHSRSTVSLWFIGPSKKYSSRDTILYRRLFFLIPPTPWSTAYLFTYLSRKSVVCLISFHRGLILSAFCPSRFGCFIIEVIDWLTCRCWYRTCPPL